MEEEFSDTEHHPQQEPLDRVVFSNQRGEMTRVGFTEINLS